MVYLKTILMRRRGAILKLVVALPALWLLGSLVTLSEKTDKGDDMELPPAVRPRDNQQQQPPPPPPPPLQILEVEAQDREPKVQVHKREPLFDVAKPSRDELSKTKTPKPHEVRKEWMWEGWKGEEG